ncbi:alpha/beta fold hydrolase [Streptomyces sp. NPDC088553]|uniref:alpha/beta fold hydrolase n=1 Tax=Streptomyces sp. NPDC088553 TaxID=3365864 RepID=UPI003817E648
MTPPLGGHSYGVWIAAHYAARYPKRIAGLVLLDPARVFAGFHPGYVLTALPMLVRPTPRRIRSFLAWETGGATLDAAWLRLPGRERSLPNHPPGHWTAAGPGPLAAIADSRAARRAGPLPQPRPRRPGHHRSTPGSADRSPDRSLAPCVPAGRS